MDDKRLVQGVGINDMQGMYKTRVHRVWHAMLERAYSAKLHTIYPTYKGCSVAKEWHTLSQFKEWFDLNYIKGFHLDKDIKVPGNKEYSSTTCMFVSSQANQLMIDRGNDRGLLPLGVSVARGRYQTYLKIKNKQKTLGTFNTPEEAQSMYLLSKSYYIDYFASMNEYGDTEETCVALKRIGWEMWKDYKEMGIEMVAPNAGLID